MTPTIALLRTDNVAVTGKVPMAELAVLCRDAGLHHVRTYSASGNVVFATEASPAGAKASMEARLLARAGKPVGVIIRTGAEMAAVLAGNPFPEAEPSRTVAIFLDVAPPRRCAGARRWHPR